MGTPLEEATNDMPVAMLMGLVERLCADVRTSVAAGTASQEDIRAYNTARKELNECRKLGMGV